MVQLAYWCHWLPFGNVAGAISRAVWHIELELPVHVAGGAAAVVEAVGGDLGRVEAFLFPLLGLQGGGWQEGPAGCPAWPWPGHPECGGVGWSVL